MREFPIPKELAALIAEGFWPKDEESARRQNLRSLVPESIIHKFAPEESKLFFYNPPFSTVQSFTEESKSEFWADFGAVTEIDPDRTLLIGDFGLGSDAPIALDYRKNENEPAVIRLRWAQEGNHWIEVAPNFAKFAIFIKSEFHPPSAG